MVIRPEHGALSLQIILLKEKDLHGVILVRTWRMRSCIVSYEFVNRPLPKGLLKKVRITPKPPKGGFINISKSISPPWGI
jgi:hypothetical protein